MKREYRKETRAFKRRVTFVFENPFAKEVTVAGTFNGWDCQKDFLRGNGSGRWSIVNYLVPGIYEYRFVVDGIWTTDPLCSIRRPNVYGGENCILEV